jgi:glycerophosphoryl diester phosphodiesterase
MDPSRLVAHRGLMATRPENTLLGLQAAILAGARRVEFDVQLTRDRVPVLLHDESLSRTAGARSRIGDLDRRLLQRYSVHEPARLGLRYATEPLPTLAAAVAALNRWPDITAFVELKRQSIERFGQDLVLDYVVSALREARFNWVLISFESAVLALARRRHRARIGWVLRAYDKTHHARAESLAPEFLFCNERHLPDDEATLWAGPWTWVVYDVHDHATAQRLEARGVDLFETPCVDRLLEAQEP